MLNIDMQLKDYYSLLYRKIESENFNEILSIRMHGGIIDHVAFEVQYIVLTGVLSWKTSVASQYTVAVAPYRVSTK